MSRIRILTTVLAGSLVGFVPVQMTRAAGGSGAAPGVSDKEIVIGSCAPLSGQQKIRGMSVVNGGRAYFAYINDHGGVDGRQIKLISCDDRYNVDDAAITCFTSCLKGKVFAGALFQGTSAASKYVAMGELSRIPLVGFSTGGDFITHPPHDYIFQLRATYNDEALAQIDTLYDKLGARRFSLIYQDDAYGAACRRGVLSALRKHGLQLVSETSYPRLSTDIDPLIDTVKIGKPDVVIIGGAGDAVSMLAKKRKAFGGNPYLVTFSSSTDLLVDEAGKQADDTLVSEVLPLVSDDLPTVKLYRKLTEQYVHEPPTASGLEGFLIAQAVVEGLKRAGKNLTREGFIHALESIHNLDIGLGPHFKLNFGPLNHDGLDGKAFLTVIKNGQVRNVPDWSAYKRSAMASR